MATNNRLASTSWMIASTWALAAPVGAHETASPATCRAAAAKPPVAAAEAAADRDPDNVRNSIIAADAWSDLGCFSDAVRVLDRAVARHPTNQELETRLRVAKSLVGEEHFFEDLDRASAAAKLKRDSFRCNTLSDVDACAAAVRAAPDDDALLIAQGDALMRAQRPADALIPWRRAAARQPNQAALSAKVKAAEAQVASVSRTQTAPAAIATLAATPAAAATAATAKPVRARPLPLQAAIPRAIPAASQRYSNAAPESQSH